MTLQQRITNSISGTLQLLTLVTDINKNNRLEKSFKPRLVKNDSFRELLKECEVDYLEVI